MNYCKKVRLMVLVSCSSLLFAGCGSVNGKYTAALDVTEIMDAAFKDEGITMPGSLSVNLSMDLDKDGSYTLSYDADQFKNDYIDYVNDNIDEILDEILENYGVSKDDYDYYLQSAGYDSYDDFKQQMIDSLESLDMSEILPEDDTETGTWSKDGDTITFETDSYERIPGTVDGRSISVEIPVPSDDDDITVTFKK